MSTKKSILQKEGITSKNDVLQKLDYYSLEKSLDYVVIVFKNGNTAGAVWSELTKSDKVLLHYLPNKSEFDLEMEELNA